jgi:ABC-2 type transport system ATP-binding protein
MTAGADTVVTTREASKWFGEVVAVNRLDLDIAAGVTGLLGPNGAGKTTLIRLILGLYSPSRGMVSVFGEDPRNNLGVLKRVGYCPELDRFFENMSGLAFVRWLCRYQGMGRREADRAARQACGRVGMAKRMDDRIETYSQGMRQRIRIAQAIAHDPELLILDEPMSGLDPEGREEIFRLVVGLGESGRTVIVSSHVLYEIERVTNDIVLMLGGRILAQGSVRHIRELIDEHPHTVRIQCSEPRVVARRFAADDSTLGLDVEGTSLCIRTADPAGFYKGLNDLVISDEIEVSSIDCPDDNLQSVFDYLVK